MSPPTTLPRVQVTPRGARRLRGGHPWVYRTDVHRPDRIDEGGVVRVVDERGNHIGPAFWSLGSPIALRLLGRGDITVDRSFFAARLNRALALRQQLWPEARCYRVVHGEADGMPGLFVDRYDDVLAVQAVSAGADAHLDVLVDILGELLQPRLVVAKHDTSAREFEGLSRDQHVLRGQGASCVEVWEGSNCFCLDVLADLKTGAFLDQRENHTHVASLVPEGGDALDTFSYHGGFALSLATRAHRVLAVEQDPLACTRLRENAQRNRRAVDVIEGNAFDHLRALERENKRFDLVVIDPPAFAKRQGELPAARRAYKELNLRGLRLLKPGGVLVSCSCSGRVTPLLFAEVLEEVASDAKRTVQIVERRGAARDHPVLLGVPETDYLKCWVLRAID
ncbi:MAG: class I SAM-dependent rRNA methyltransferase [Pseudomonadota bacterium]